MKSETFIIVVWPVINLHRVEMSSECFHLNFYGTLRVDIKPFSNREIYHLLSSVRLFAFTMSFLFRLTKQGRKHLLLPSLFQLSSSPKQLLKSTYGKSCK